jgi:hypothetical protein
MSVSRKSLLVSCNKFICQTDKKSNEEVSILARLVLSIEHQAGFFILELP